MSGSKRGATLAAGSFVWCNFPFGPPHAPDRPGPERHIGYVLADRGTGASLQVLVAYTSSGPWRGGRQGARLPLGVIEFDTAVARAVGQRPFHLDLRCLALVPVTPAWFPDLPSAGGGVVAVAPPPLRERLFAAAAAVAARSPELIEVRGVKG